MARLFITHREQQFLQNIASEFSADVVGQYIIYYPVSMLHTRVHKVYDEAIEKIFENPIKITVLAGQPERTNSYSKFGIDSETKIELYIQARKLIDNDLEVNAGDFFIYGNEVYEIVDAIDIENIFGQAEYEKGIKISGQLSRIGEFDIEDFKNMLEQGKTFANGSTQKTFVQQRGLDETEEGFTGDVRGMRERLGDDMMPVALGEGVRKISVDETDSCDVPFDEATDAEGNSFYNE
jgi:hypothetical protein